MVLLKLLDTGVDVLNLQKEFQHKIKKDVWSYLML